MTIDGSHLISWPPSDGRDDQETPKYRDFSALGPDDVPPSPQPSLRAERRRKGPKELSFPTKLHDLLTECNADDDDELSDTISWQEHGRSFIVFDKKQFAAKYVIFC
jgi:HSF-type DNA-binding